MSASITVRVPITIRQRGGRRLVVAPDSAPWSPPRARIDNTLIKALRNVSTTLIQPGSEFKLGYDASIELRGAGRVRQRLVLACAIRGSNRRRAWVRVA